MEVILGRYVTEGDAYKIYIVCVVVLCCLHENKRFYGLHDSAQMSFTITGDKLYLTLRILYTVNYSECHLVKVIYSII